jgi:hypothetical protein
MERLFLACAFAGGAILALQLVLGLLGLDHHDAAGAELGHDGHAFGADAALNLLSVRALLAGVTFFGLAGLALAERAAWLSLPGAALAGAAAAVAVAALMRSMLRAESDGVVRLEGAVGRTGSVYLSIPAGGDVPGKVHLHLQGRLVECQAVSREALSTGTSVLVIDVAGPGTVEVVPSPLPGASEHAP